MPMIMISTPNPLLHDNRPQSIAQCVGPNGFDAKNFKLYMSFRSDEARQRTTKAVAASYHSEPVTGSYRNFEDASINDEEPLIKRRRKKSVMTRQTNDGDIVEMSPK